MAIRFPANEFVGQDKKWADWVEGRIVSQEAALAALGTAISANGNVTDASQSLLGRRLRAVQDLQGSIVALQQKLVQVAQ